MIHYMDMTYCGYYPACAHSRDCHRPLTPEVCDKADSERLPICQFAEKPHCFEEVKNVGILQRD